MQRLGFAMLTAIPVLGVFVASALHKKWSFPLRISSVNETKSAGNCGFRHIYWRSASSKTFEQCCLSEIWLLFAKLVKYWNIICTSQTEEIFCTEGLKLNVPLEYFITAECLGICSYFILKTCSNVLFTDTRTLWDQSWRV